MNTQHNALDAEIIGHLVKSVTKSGEIPLTSIEAERLLNAIARAQSGVPTGVVQKPELH